MGIQSLNAIHWGVLGAGQIAKVFCQALQFSTTGSLVAIASRTPGRSAALAQTFGCDTVYDDYASLLANDQIDAVYVATINSQHLEPVLSALAHGKHVLVEKPIAVKLADAQQMIDAARDRGLFLMEGFMYRCHPQIEKMVELIETGTIGEVRFIRSDFGYSIPSDAQVRNFDKQQGGGGILDVGCYPVSMCRLVAGAAAGKPFLNPIDVQAVGVTGPTGVDHYAAAVLKFENDILATVTAAVTCEIPSITVIHGSEGILTVAEPWTPSSPCRQAQSRLPADQSFADSQLILAQRDSDPDVIHIPADRDLFSYEIDAVGQCLANHQTQCSRMRWDDTIGNMQTLNRWLSEVGVDFDY